MPVASAPALAPTLPPYLRTLLALAAAVIALAGLYFGRELVGPLALAAVLVMICEPVRRPLLRSRWPRWLATTAVIVLAYLVLAALGALLLWAGVQFARLVVDFTDELRATTDAVVSWLQTVGIDQQAADAVASVLQPSNLATLATSLGGTAVGVLTALFFIVAYVIFMAADTSRYVRAASAADKGGMPVMQAFSDYSRNVRKYFVVNATFGVIVAVIDGLALWAVGVPAPVVWAILAFVTNFVPNIGFVLGLIPPAVLALVVGGWPLMLVVVGIYIVVNVVLQVLVQPKFVSDAVDLSLTLSFFSVVFWTFVIGPLGAILSIPLTLLVREVVLGEDPSTRGLRWLSGRTDAMPGPAAPPGS